MKTAVIDVGGGLRGAYSAGVYDYFLDEGVSFDAAIGISAGSANLASYLAGQRGRTYTFYTEYTFRKEYMSVHNFITKKSYLDMDYIYGTLSNSGGDNPLDYQAIMANPTEFFVAAANADTGQTKYFDKSDLHQDDYRPMMASCSIPFVCRPYEIDGIPYYDGALGDTIPLQKALELGCGQIVLVLTKPRDVVRTSGKDNFFAGRIQKKYPKAAERLRGRADRYNQGVALARELEARGQCLIIAPDDTCGVDTLTRDREAMVRLYEKGYHDGKPVLDFLKHKKCRVEP